MLLRLRKTKSSALSLDTVSWTSPSVRTVWGTGATFFYSEGEIVSLYDDLSLPDENAAPQALGDFCPVGKGEIPIVIGSALNADYAVGELITVREYAGADGVGDGRHSVYEYLACRVCGVLEDSSVLIDPNPSGFDNDGYIRLDYMMMIPTLDWMGYYAENALTEPFLINAALQTQGVAVLETSQFNFAEYFSGRGVSGVNPRLCMRVSKAFVKQADAYFENLTAAAALILVCTAVCLSINLSNKLMSQIKTYGVHLISGATIFDINMYMASEALFTALVSEIAAVVGALLLKDIFVYSNANIFSVSAVGITPGSLLLILATGAAVTVLALIAPLVRLNTVEFDTLLRGRE